VCPPEPSCFNGGGAPTNRANLCIPPPPYLLLLLLLLHVLLLLHCYVLLRWLVPVIAVEHLWWWRILQVS